MVADTLTSKAFGATIKQLRHAKKLTKEALAFDAHISRNTINALEHGHSQPSLKTVFKLAQALNIPPEELVKKTRIKLEIA